MAMGPNYPKSWMMITDLPDLLDFNRIKPFHLPNFPKKEMDIGLKRIYRHALITDRI